MAQFRMQVNYNDSGGLPRDVIVNTFYLDTDVINSDPDDLTTDTAVLFATYRPIPNQFPTVTVRAYDMSDAEPRQPVATATEDCTSGSASGPREVALCLSYYAGRNLPRLRGRMYIGPWGGTLSERPAAGTRQDLATLAEGISGLGGVDVQWVQYSPTTGDYTNVSHYWIDDEWDTHRSRGLRATTRTSGTVSG